MNPRAVALTLGLHAAIAIAFLPSCVQIASPPQKRPQPHDEPLVYIVGTSGNGSLACASSYTGFGVMAGQGGRVYYVAPGAPADRAHIREGDLIENIDDFYADQFETGQEIALQVRRDGVLTVKRLRIERICYA